jgi:glycine cleavage system aminomethyltransferase T/glycine/D-amino acid oxidase-like deaminating enzyme
MATFPKSANVVIVGQGGIVGASVVHHLIERGWDDIVGIDKSSIPTDIGSTAHASDFCFMTAHDHMTCYTTTYSAEFYDQLGHYERCGGIEVARVGDDQRMEELKRKVGSGKAFGTRVELISPAQVKELCPLVEESMIQGAMWDPDAGLVVPRSQAVAGELVQRAEATGKLKTFANTPVTGLEIEDGRIKAVHTHRGTIEANYVVVCAGLWSRLISEMAGEDLPVMPVDHPLLFFGPYTQFEGTGKEIGYPLLRDQGNSAYLRDTGDPKTTEGGQIEWGYYEKHAPRLVHPRDILEKEQARLSPSQRDLEIDQVMEPLEKAMELTPVLGEIGFDERRSYNGLLQVTADGGPSIGESPKVRGLWYGVSVWVKDGPGTGKVIADWMTDGRTEVDHHGIDVSRYYPIQKTPSYIYDRCYETAFKIYDPPVHTREPYTKGRNLRCSPFYAREQELGGYFMEAAGWERAHGYASNEKTLLEKWGERIPERHNEWDARHFWRVSNAEHLEISENVGMVNLSHFAIYDVSGPDAEALLEFCSVAKVGGNTPVGKGVYTNFLDHEGGVRADLTIIRLAEDRYRVIDGGDAGNRDYVWMLRMAEDYGHRVHIEDRSDNFGCLGVWGPNARTTLQQLADHPEQLDPEQFPFAAARDFTLRGIPVKGFRISYVGEQGWELHFPFSYGLALWDMLYEAGVTPIGIETYANSRRLEKSLRLQNADLLTEYNLYEAGLARPKVKPMEFYGKAAYMAQREQAQPAYLCTLTMDANVDAQGVARYPVGSWPILDPETGDVLVDAKGRRSYTTSVAYGPSIGKNIALAYLPYDDCKEGRQLVLEYFQETYPVTVAAVGYKPLYDPKNERPKS